MLKLGQQTITGKFTILIALLLVFSMTFLSVVTYTSFSQMVDRKVVQLSENLLALANQNLNYIIADVKDTSNLLLTSSSIQQVLLYADNGQKVLEYNKNLIEATNLMNNMVNNKTYLSSVYIGNPNLRLTSRKGDHFSLRILGEQLLYEVDQILVVEPDEVKDLYPVEGEDLVTLVTCTPYGVNTHRLLVRGHRIPLETVEETVEVTVTQQVVHSLGWKGKLLIGALLLFLLILLILALLRRKKKKTGPEEGNVIERGRTDEKASQSRSGPDPDHTAVSPRDSTDSRF